MEIIIPTSLSEVTLKQFLKFKELDLEKSDDIFIAKKMISIFCNLEMQVVEQLSMQDFQEISNILVHLLNSEVEFKPTFTYKGKEFGFIPNLDKLSFGEYIDIDNSFKDNDLNSFLQVVYRPITEKLKDKYKIEPYDIDKLEDMTEVPYDVYKGAEVFFYTLGTNLLKAMKTYLQEQAQASNQKSILISGINGVGITQLLNSLEEISLSLTELQKLKSVKPLLILHT